MEVEWLHIPQFGHLKVERGLSPVLLEPQTRYPVNEDKAEQWSRMLHNDNVSLRKGEG